MKAGVRCKGSRVRFQNGNKRPLASAEAGKIHWGVASPLPRLRLNRMRKWSNLLWRAGRGAAAAADFQSLFHSVPVINRAGENQQSILYFNLFPTILVRAVIRKERAIIGNGNYCKKPLLFAPRRAALPSRAARSSTSWLFIFSFNRRRLVNGLICVATRHFSRRTPGGALADGGAARSIRPTDRGGGCLKKLNATTRDVWAGGIKDGIDNNSIRRPPPAPAPPATGNWGDFSPLGGRPPPAAVRPAHATQTRRHDVSHAVSADRRRAGLTIAVYSRRASPCGVQRAAAAACARAALPAHWRCRRRDLFKFPLTSAIR
ncbi:hypothetical protein EVAR_2471_1 [Eumeta japonica]|uniref:Uncharacterized protein n=1 Tax=Eumeta variegata TaxID=151549 RepID=A0A4C1SPA7_EUMVA|nr:hypothetical protein EVAR_2471_1 [Eumeta japonica]